MTFVQNPIRRGFFPDPSVCRAGDYYYCVHSSFAYAPGIPVFRSKNFIEWESLGHVLTRKSQLSLEGLAVREGIYAPTIRFYQGMFYVVATNVSGGGAFLVTSENPKKGWSDPVYFSEAEGIDPSLYFEDEKCYFIGQRMKREPAYSGACEIWARELDLKQKKLGKEVYVLWDGSMKKSIWDEGPHIYKRGDYYYLLVAEGGTEFSHSICVARSKELMGTYEGCPNNPVFTHRHLGKEYPVQNVGHGDMIETKEGNWYIFMLGSRVFNGCSQLGRETFLADVSWQDDWPVINKGEGKLRNYQEVINEKDTIEEFKQEKTKKRKKYHLQEMLQEHKLLGLRHFPEENIETIKRSGTKKDTGSIITIPFQGQALQSKSFSSFVGIRMEEADYELSAHLTCTLQENAEAGLACFYDEKNMICFGIKYFDDMWNICITKYENAAEQVLCVKEIEKPVRKKGHFKLKLVRRNHKLMFFCDGEEVLGNINTDFLSDQKTNGFTGTMLGMYACKKGENAVGCKKSQNEKAAFSQIKAIFRQ